MNGLDRDNLPGIHAAIFQFRLQQAEFSELLVPRCMLFICAFSAERLKLDVQGSALLLLPEFKTQHSEFK
jgi:hypothetical protein